jgi:hypothetical protein
MAAESVSADPVLRLAAIPTPERSRSGNRGACRHKAEGPVPPVIAPRVAAFGGAKYCERIFERVGRTRRGASGEKGQEVD